VAVTKSALLGFVYLFVFSVGMCALLIVVGIFGASVARLPRSGTWMLWIKRVLALVMIGAAEYYFVRAGTTM
jgi:thiol:disulfide interchange protein DsbD